MLMVSARIKRASTVIIVNNIAPRSLLEYISGSAIWIGTEFVPTFCALRVRHCIDSVTDNRHVWSWLVGYMIV